MFSNYVCLLEKMASGYDAMDYFYVFIFIDLSIWYIIVDRIYLQHCNHLQLELNPSI